MVKMILSTKIKTKENIWTRITRNTYTHARMRPEINARQRPPTDEHTF
jgi:hypothetical protein